MKKRRDWVSNPNGTRFAIREIDREFISLVNQTMLKKGISQSELSRMSGISPPMVSMYFKGIRKPSFYVVVQLANALGIRLGSFQKRFEIKPKGEK